MVFYKNTSSEYTIILKPSIWKSISENDANAILELKNKIKQTDKEIDERVFRLYNLTENEIEIIKSENIKIPISA